MSILATFGGVKILSAGNVRKADLIYPRINLSGLEDTDNWIEYNSQESRINFKYPRMINVNNSETGIELVLSGPEQMPNKKFGDGIAVKISKGITNGKTIESIAKITRENMAKKYTDSTVVVSSIENYSGKNSEGYQFRITDSSERRYIFIPYHQDSFLMIIDCTKDPENLGYHQTVESILSSLQ